MFPAKFLNHIMENSENEIQFMMHETRWCKISMPIFKDMENII